MNRRDFLLSSAAAPLMASLASASAFAAQGRQGPADDPAARPAQPARPRTKLRQGVMSSVWGQSKLTPEQQYEILQKIGYVAVDLPSEKQVSVMAKYKLLPSMMTGTGTSFQNGIIRKEMHDQFEKATREGIDMCARVGCPNLIALPGERRGMSREEGAENAVAFFNRVKGYAEQKNVTLCMEITNSKIAADQRTDQVFDHVAWGFDICKRVNSPRLKIVYDIYHVQVADGNIVQTMRDNIDWICHIHVAGNPGRQEIDETQEVNYRYVANAIADLGYTGFVSHEWRPGPGRDFQKSLEQCFKIMDV
jgi:hydroxypyruvate isomerase